ncbi:MAG: hypothetical protein HQL27_03660 [Candidatus Omnitrophica bacterium]|nr:hypothetical protein [Candidatus Omnitrophota bacterium]
MSHYLPFIISSLIGLLSLNLILKKETGVSFLLKLFLGAGLGFALCANIVFLSLMAFHRFNKPFVITTNLLLLLILTAINLRTLRIKLSFEKKHLIDTGMILTIGLLLIPVWQQAGYYIYGGWDAWSVWNLKAKFIFLGGHSWERIFSPLLWRSSPHYPLLLPLMNVWGWAFLKEASFLGPLLNSFIFTFLLSGLFFFGLKDLTKSNLGIIPLSFMLTLHIFQASAYSQYCDLFMAYYLVAAYFTILSAKKRNSAQFALLSGIMLGILSFTKNEGLIAAIFLLALAMPFLRTNGKKLLEQSLIKSLFYGAAIGFTPTIIFSFIYAPKNITFINGLFSLTNPVSLTRIQNLVSLYSIEFFSPVVSLFRSLPSAAGNLIPGKWSLFWVVIIVVTLFGWKRLFRKDNLLYPSFLLLYGIFVTFYYFINTYFEIGWWVSVTLYRIIFSILPVFIFWFFYSLWKED